VTTESASPNIVKYLCLSLALGFASAASAQTVGFAVTSDGASAATADRLQRITLETGVAQSLGALSGSFEDVEGLSFDANGNLFGIDDATKTLVSVNLANGRATAIGGVNGNTRLSVGENNAQDPSLSFSCSNELFVATKTARALYKASTSTGALELIGTAGGLDGRITDIAFRADQLFGLGEEALYKINPSTGISTRVGLYGAGIDFVNGGGLAVDATGQLWAVAETRRADATLENSVLYKIDYMTGAATRIASTVGGVESLAIGPTPCSSELMASAPLATQLPVLNSLGLFLLSLLLIFGAYSYAPRRS
jgi:hypothetical protein